MGHGRIFLSEDLARFPIAFRQSVGYGRTPFRFVTSGVATKEEFQSRALGKSEGTTQTMVKIWGLGAWQAPYAVSSPTTERPYLKTGLS